LYQVEIEMTLFESEQRNAERKIHLFDPKGPCALAN